MHDISTFTRASENESVMEMSSESFDEFTTRISLYESTLPIFIRGIRPTEI